MARARLRAPFWLRDPPEEPTGASPRLSISERAEGERVTFRFGEDGETETPAPEREESEIPLAFRLLSISACPGVERVKVRGAEEAGLEAEFSSPERSKGR